VLCRTATLGAAAALLVGCGSSASPAHAAKPGARYYEQRRAKMELRGALHPDEHLPPPVCMRFPPEGPRIVAVVLGSKNRHRDEAAFRSLHLTAVFRISTMAAYEAHLATLARQMRRVEPHGHSNLRIEWQGFHFTEPLRPKEEIAFDPLCPRVEIGIHAKGLEPTKTELAWAESMTRLHGSDFVSIFYGTYGEAV
jgi:hypothetical protein